MKWIEEVRELCGPSIPVLLVGCKKDLRDQNHHSNGGGMGYVTREQVSPFPFLTLFPFLGLM